MLSALLILQLAGVQAAPVPAVARGDAVHVEKADLQPVARRRHADDEPTGNPVGGALVGVFAYWFCGGGPVGTLVGWVVGSQVGNLRVPLGRALLTACVFPGVLWCGGVALTKLVFGLPSLALRVVSSDATLQVVANVLAVAGCLVLFGCSQGAWWSGLINMGLSITAGRPLRAGESFANFDLWSPADAADTEEDEGEDDDEDDDEQPRRRKQRAPDPAWNEGPAAPSYPPPQTNYAPYPQPAYPPPAYPPVPVPPVPVPAPPVVVARAIWIVVNGVNVTGARSLMFENANVQVDAYGSLVITAPGAPLPAAEGLGQAPTSASVFLNGRDVSDQRSQAWSDCTVTVDAAGDVHINSVPAPAAPILP
ncbi:MAG: hypothetical protein HY904_03365 [Deltaproteobacteria bacterium]|nr:hypothetical protein [Deltaproteobacteria bacterium]